MGCTVIVFLGDTMEIFQLKNVVFIRIALKRVK